MKNEKSAKDASEKTAVERWENEGGEVLNVPEIETSVRAALIDKTPLPSVGKNRERRGINFFE